ncbi:iron-containing alcohol dehydrogenase [Treponema sp. OMZ 840]|uniref:iron-containing alcohol dehydrogenase n=1 Tax=Treponema sp. OMZ 840 TaxID=244313 RepID=UPI003D8F82B6
MINNFYFSFPTKYIFGINTISQIENELSDKSITRLCVLAGKYSAEKLGILKIIETICHKQNINYYEYKIIDGKASRENIEYINDFLLNKKINFIIAVGGGTIIDIAKTIKSEFNNIEFGVVLTHPASSSESNNSYVYYDNIKNKKIAKRSMNAYPSFSICDPTYMETLTKKQMYSSFSDVFSHLLEQFFAIELTFIDDMIIACLQRVVNLFELYQKKLFTINEQMEYMLLTSMALSYIFSNGRTMDWVAHQVEHSLSEYSIGTHGENLAIIMPAWVSFSQNNQYYSKKLEYLSSKINHNNSKKISGLFFIQSFYSSISENCRLSSMLKNNFILDKYLGTLFDTPLLGRVNVINLEQFSFFFNSLI